MHLFVASSLSIILKTFLCFSSISLTSNHEKIFQMLSVGISKLKFSLNFISLHILLIKSDFYFELVLFQSYVSKITYPYSSPLSTELQV